MSDFDALVDELLRSRPELTKEELMRRIAEKKQTVGAGYLTDQGALFLVAGELGVSLQRSISSDLSLRDLHIGANDITVVARALAIYPVSTYQRKKDGGSGRYRRLVLFDKDLSARLTIWDDNVDDPEKLGISTGSALRVVNGYVKQGLDGKPNLNLGSRGRLELVENSKLPTLDDLCEKLSKTTAERPVIAVECTVTSEPRYSEFVRSDGSPGSLYQFGVGGQGNKEQYRLVIWSPSSRPELRVGQKVRITNLKFKKSSRGEFELHGDAGTEVLPQAKTSSEIRIAAISKIGDGSLIIGLDKDRRLKLVETQLDTASFKPGDAIAVIPDQEPDGRMLCRSPGSLSLGGGDGLPSLAELVVKVKDVKDESSQIMVEVIALSHGAVDDVNMKDGSVVKKGELIVGDDTGEINVIGWREYSTKVSGIEPGERLRIVGIAPKQSKMGAWTLQLSALTVIERLKGRG